MMSKAVGFGDRFVRFRDLVLGWLCGPRVRVREHGACLPLESRVESVRTSHYDRG